MEKALSTFAPGEKGRVIRLMAEGGIKKRLLDMGITPGADIMMRKSAPLGDPIELTLRGYELSIRKADAQHVLMQMDGGDEQ